MSIKYSIKARAFTRNGRVIPQQELRDEIDKLTAHVAQSARRLAKQVESGTITPAVFESKMRELLKSGHIVASSVGKGGRSRMTQRDWGRVGAKLKWQFGFLAKFTKRVASGNVSAAMTASRAASYASSIYISFARTYHETQSEKRAGAKNPSQVRLITNSAEGCTECAADEAEGWMSVDDMGLLGTRLCGDFCKCDLEFDFQSDEL